MPKTVEKLTELLDECQVQVSYRVQSRACHQILVLTFRVWIRQARSHQNVTTTRASKKARLLTALLLTTHMRCPYFQHVSLLALFYC